MTGDMGDRVSQLFAEVEGFVQAEGLTRLTTLTVHCRVFVACTHTDHQVVAS